MKNFFNKANLFLWHFSSKNKMTQRASEIKFKKIKRCRYSERHPTRWRFQPGWAHYTLRAQKFWVHPKFAPSKKWAWCIRLRACFHFRLSHHLMFLGLHAFPQFSGDFGEQTCSSCRSKDPRHNQIDRWYLNYLKSQHLIQAHSHNVLPFPRF